MLSADGLIDGSYDVTVHVTEINENKNIRVRGDVHVGGLMLRIVNALSKSHFKFTMENTKFTMQFMFVYCHYIQ